MADVAGLGRRQALRRKDEEPPVRLEVSENSLPIRGRSDLTGAGDLDTALSRGALSLGWARTSDVAPDKGVVDSALADLSAAALPEAFAPLLPYLRGAGLTSAEVRQLLTAGLTGEDAAHLLQTLWARPISLMGYGPKMVLVAILAEASEGLSAEDFAQRYQAHQNWVVVRPDGYFARAVTGDALGKAGLVSYNDGVLQAGNWDVGDIFVSDQGVLYPLDADGQADRGQTPVELGLQTPLILAPIDGVANALKATIIFVGDLIVHPIRTLEDLAKLPLAIGQLVSSSPELLERFLAMPLNDQVEVTAEILGQIALAKGLGRAAQTKGTAGLNALKQLELKIQLPQRWVPGAALAESVVSVRGDIWAKTLGSPPLGQAITAATLAGARPDLPDTLGPLQVYRDTPSGTVTPTKGPYVGQKIEFGDKRGGGKHTKIASLTLAEIQEGLKGKKVPAKLRKFAEAIKKREKEYGSQLSKEATDRYGELVQLAVENGRFVENKLVYTASFPVGIDVVTGKPTSTLTVYGLQSNPKAVMQGIHLVPGEIR